jgi:hypothetical protein
LIAVPFAHFLQSELGLPAIPITIYGGCGFRGSLKNTYNVVISIYTITTTPVQALSEISITSNIKTIITLLFIWGWDIVVGK